jgi:sec-independent protein translocase protein TatA
MAPHVRRCDKEVPMPFGLQPLHIIVIILVALIIFGPSRLQEIGRGMGKAINEFRKGTKEMTEGFKDEVTKPESSVAPVAASQPQPEGGNFCTKCGSPNPADAQFCNKCGAQLTS